MVLVKKEIKRVVIGDPSDNTKVIQIWPSSSRKPGANTVAYYPLDNVNTVNDLSGNGLNGTKNGTITFGTGLGGVDCALFSGNSGSYIQVAHNAKMATNTITYSMWVASKDYNGNRGIFYKGAFSGGNGIYALANYTNLDWRIGSTSHSYGVFGGNDIWTHIVVTYDGSVGKVYKNGTLVGQYNQTATISGDTNPLYIGAYWSSSYCFYGYMSNLIIENKIWTDTEVLDYFNQTQSLYGIN